MAIMDVIVGSVVIIEITDLKLLTICINKCILLATDINEVLYE